MTEQALQTRCVVLTHCCASAAGLESFVEINIKVQDINDNKPELTSEQDIFVCENDMSETVRTAAPAPVTKVKVFL